MNRPAAIVPMPSQSEREGFSPSLVMASTASRAIPAVFMGCTTDKGASPTAIALIKVPPNCRPWASSQGRQRTKDLIVGQVFCDPIKGSVSSSRFCIYPL